MPPVSVRLMTENDLPAADELRRLAGWNQTPADWTRLLALEPGGCFVAEAAGQLAGSVTTTTYGDALAWLGMMLVHPQLRHQGIGSVLMTRALAYLKLQNVACVKLDATPAGYPLYTRLGFVPEWTLTRWQAQTHGRKPGANTPSKQTRGLEDEDWPAIETMDAAVLGQPRLRLLQSLAKGGSSSLVWPAVGPISGWGLLRPGANAQYLGPLVCPSPEGASSLVMDLLAAGSQNAVFWDIPDQNQVAAQLALRFGFQPVRPLTRMRLGPNSSLGSPYAQLGIADPALG